MLCRCFMEPLLSDLRTRPAFSAVRSAFSVQCVLFGEFVPVYAVSLRHPRNPPTSYRVLCIVLITTGLQVVRIHTRRCVAHMPNQIVPRQTAPRRLVRKPMCQPQHPRSSTRAELPVTPVVCGPDPQPTPGVRLRDVLLLKPLNRISGPSHVSSSPGLSPVSRATKSFTVIITSCCPGSPMPRRLATTRPATASSLPRSVPASRSHWAA